MKQEWLKNYPKDVEATIYVDPEKSIYDHFKYSMQKFPNNPSVTCMGKTLTYSELSEEVDSFAAYLQKVLGMRKGDRLAIMLPNVIQFPVAFLAAQKIGVICVNTNPLYTPREMKHQFCDSSADAIIILDMFLDKLEKIVDETSIEHVIVTGIGDQFSFLKSFVVQSVLTLKGQLPKHTLNVIHYKNAVKQGKMLSCDPVKMVPDDTAVLQYTGGTTGVSKGAELTSGNIIANTLQIRAWARPLLTDGEEIVLTALPLYHVFALSVNFLSFLNMGNHLILVPKPVPVDNLVKIFKSYRITAMTGVNTLFNALNNNKSFQELAPKSLKISLAGGMALQESVSKKWKEITGRAIIQGFGLTEASPVTHCELLDKSSPPGTVGLPFPSTFAKVVNDAGEEVEIGKEGELVVKGPQVMKGYWKRPDETAKVLKDGWLWTGDMARMDENGYFYIVDRKKDMILVSGFNVFPNEVEGVIASHPKVLEVAVIGVPDANSGEAVKAFIVPKDPSLNADEIKKFCADQLTNYKRPRFVEFRKELPKSNVGKIIRRELRDEKPKV